MSYETVKAIPMSESGCGSGQHLTRIDEHSDIQWFRRNLQCQTCQEEWLSAEVPEDYLDELVELRNALAEIREHADRYTRESKLAAASLQKLSKSLGALKALDRITK